jgi:hypothetical protein
MTGEVRTIELTLNVSSVFHDIRIIMIHREIILKEFFHYGESPCEPGARKRGKERWVPSLRNPRARSDFKVKFF